MTALNFPNAPTVGQTYPSPPTTGVSVYKWDGAAWQAVSSGSASDLPSGGATGQVLVKNTAADFDTAWTTPNSVRYDTVQTLTATQQTQARSNIYAAPFDALAYSGMQINGSCEVSQENGTAQVTVPTGAVTNYILDGWTVSKTGTSVLVAQQIIQPTLPDGYANAVQLSATSPQASIGSDYVRFLHRIEGLRSIRAKWGTTTAVPITFGFWARMTLPGTYQAIAYNLDGSTVTPWMPFTINSSLVWQWVTLQFPAQTTGTWKTDNTAGIIIAIEVASSTTPNTVGATNQYAAVTGLIVLPGIELPSASRAPFIMRPYDQELWTCKRYFVYETYATGGKWVFPIDLTSGYRRAIHQFSPAMRATPTVALTGGTTGTFGPSQPQIGSATPYSCELEGDVTGGGYSYILSLKADARL